VSSTLCEKSKPYFPQDRGSLLQVFAKVPTVLPFVPGSNGGFSPSASPPRGSSENSIVLILVNGVRMGNPYLGLGLLVYGAVAGMNMSACRDFLKIYLLKDL